MTEDQNKIIEEFDANRNEGVALDANWTYFPNPKFGMVAVVLLKDGTWALNNNCKITIADFDTILKMCIDLVQEHNRKDE